MTRKDYSLIAKVISGLKGYVATAHSPIRELVCDNFVAVLKRENGNFNEEKFRTACNCERR